MDIFIHGSARKFMDKLDEKKYLHIKEYLKKLAENPFSNQLDIKKLKGIKGGQDAFRLRVGEYRIIYFIQENKIWVTEIMIRNKGYDF